MHRCSSQLEARSAANELRTVNCVAPPVVGNCSLVSLEPVQHWPLPPWRFAGRPALLREGLQRINQSPPALLPQENSLIQPTSPSLVRGHLAADDDAIISVGAGTTAHRLNAQLRNSLCGSALPEIQPRITTRARASTGEKTLSEKIADRVGDATRRMRPSSQAARSSEGRSGRAQAGRGRHVHGGP